MYSSFQLAKKYFHYYFQSKNGKGHGVHSPFVFDFIIHVLNDRKNYPCYDTIEPLRRSLLQNTNQIEVEDFGAGSTAIPFNNRKMSDIARHSLKKKKYGQLLFRIARYYHSKNIVELGTSLGITTCYLASSNKDTNVITLEGSGNIAKIATQNFKKAGIDNIELLQGSFDKTIYFAFDKYETVDLLFIDGNHRKKPTLEYFDLFLKKANEDSIFILDDIHWSLEMEDAWEQVKQHPSVTLSIDLFFIGLVFFSKDFKVKQDFPIRF